jgi:hypothetical protein
MEVVSEWNFGSGGQFGIHALIWVYLDFMLYDCLSFIIHLCYFLGFVDIKYLMYAIDSTPSDLMFSI